MTTLSAFVGAVEPDGPGDTADGPPPRTRWRRRQRGEVSASSLHVREQP
ncbi:hypothetical protein AB0D11_24910 [Streptomyces monashensis]